MKNCIFCKIVQGEIPCYKVYEDEKFLAFLDIRPLNLGHTLVIPKKHYRWVWEVENIEEYFKVVQKIALAMKQSLETDYIVSLIFGEEVEHAHIWLVPRYENDGHGPAIDLKNIKEFSQEQMAEVAEKIHAAINL